MGGIRQDVPIETVELDPEGIGDIINGTVEMLHDVAGTCYFLLRGMKGMKDRGVMLVVDPAKGEDPDAEREYNDIMEILTLMRDNIPRKVYDLVAINQKVTGQGVKGSRIKDN